MVKQFTDVPLPGLGGLGGRVGHDERSERRRYDRLIEPTPEAIERFWSHVVSVPGDGCWAARLAAAHSSVRNASWN